MKLRLLIALVLLAGTAHAGARSAWDRPIARSSASRALKQVLADVRASARRGEQPLVAVDIDDTSLDGRPRLRAAAQQVGLPSRRLASQADLYAGFDGQAREDKRAAFGALYFNDPNLAKLDRAQRGAPRFLRAVRRAGGRVLYVSGRWESTRPDTEATLRQHRLPLGASSDLLLNPSEHVRASDYKREVRARIAREGKVVAVFDNEAEAIEGYHEAFPAAHAFRLATFRFREPSGDKPADVMVVRDFSLGRAGR